MGKYFSISVKISVNISGEFIGRCLSLKGINKGFSLKVRSHNPTMRDLECYPRGSFFWWYGWLESQIHREVSQRICSMTYRNIIYIYRHLYTVCFSMKWSVGKMMMLLFFWVSLVGYVGFVKCSRNSWKQFLKTEQNSSSMGGVLLFHCIIYCQLLDVAQKRVVYRYISKSVFCII